MVVNAADYRLNLDVMRGALGAGAHYVDLGGLFHVTRQQLELDAEFRAAGLTAILGLGSAPGKTNLLAAAAARRLGRDPVSMEIWAATRDPAAAGHPFPAPYSVQTLRDELQMRPVILRDGELEEVDPVSGAATRDFPEPVGPAEGIFTLHSELATLPVSLPTLREASFRLCLSPGLLEKLLALEDGELPGAVHAVSGVGRGARGRASRRRRARRGADGDARRERQVDVGAGCAGRRRACRRTARRNRVCTHRRSRSMIPRRSSRCSTQRWPGSVRDLSRSCDRHVTGSSLGCRSWQRKLQRHGDRRRSSRS